MDLYRSLSRMLMRRKYARVEEKAAGAPPAVTKSKSMRSSRTEKKMERSSRPAPPSASEPREEPRVVTMPKGFTLRSSNNEVIDDAWFNSALRRSVAEGRLNLSNLAV